MTNQEARRIANWIFREGTSNTQGGNWIIGFDEIKDLFGIELTNDDGMEIIKWLNKLYPEAVLDAFISIDYDDVMTFDVTYGDWYYDCDDPSVYDNEYDA